MCKGTYHAQRDFLIPDFEILIAALCLGSPVFIFLHSDFTHGIMFHSCFHKTHSPFYLYTDFIMFRYEKKEPDRKERLRKLCTKVKDREAEVPKYWYR